jgi:hypothetical protein
MLWTVLATDHNRTFKIFLTKDEQSNRQQEGRKECRNETLFGCTKPILDQIRFDNPVDVRPVHDHREDDSDSDGKEGQTHFA